MRYLKFILAAFLAVSPTLAVPTGPILKPSKLNDVLYATSYATGGVGSSADPWTSASGTGGIQEAIDACPSTGCHVIASRGQFESSKCLFIKSNVWLSGDGEGVTIIKRKAATQTDATSEADGPMICAGSAQGTYYSQGSPGENITISGLTVDGNYSAQTATSSATGKFNGIRIAMASGGTPAGNVNGITIRNVTVKNTLQDGIYIYNAKNVLIDGNTTFTTGQIAECSSKNGITVSSTATERAAGFGTNVVISNNRVSYSGDATVRCAEGIVTRGLNNVTIADNDISHVDFGIEINNSDNGTTLTNYSITGNTIHDLVEGTTYGGYGITFPTSSATSRYGSVTISGNTFRNLNTIAIAASRTDGLTITGNVATATNLVAKASSNRAINLDGVHGGVISGNTIRFESAVAGVIGINVQGLVGTDTTTGIVVSGNSITGVPTGGSEYGIQVGGDATAILVDGNRIVGGDYGVRINSTGTNSGIRVVNNLASGYGTAAYIDQSSQANFVNTIVAAEGATTANIDGNRDGTTDWTINNETILALSNSTNGNIRSNRSLVFRADADDNGAGDIFFDADGDTTSDSYISATTFTHPIDTDFLFRSDGGVSLVGDVDNDGAGNEYVRIDADGDATYDWTFTASALTPKIGATVNMTSGIFRAPNSTSLPATCTVGDTYFDTDATAGQNSYGCTATNTWTLQGDGGGSISFNNISGGTNTTATMIVGTGSSLSASGGTITATSILGSGVSGNIPGNAAGLTGTLGVANGGTNITSYAQGDLLYASAATTLAKLAKNTTANRYLSNTGSSNNPAWAQIDLSTVASFTGALPATLGGTGLSVGTSGGINYWSSTTTQASSALLAANGVVIGGGAGVAPSTSATTINAAGSMSVPATQTIDIAAHTNDGGYVTIKEGGDDGSDTVVFKVPDAGLAASKTITFVAATGNIPASAIEDSGTTDKCARFNGSGILVPDTGDCSASAGDVTGVGAGCTSGACFTDGLVTSGTSWMVWEGSTADANQINIVAPADPTAVYSLTFPDATSAITMPSGTDTVAGNASTSTFTNKTLNVESTGNVLTTLEKIWLPAAGCNNATAATFWDLPTSLAPTPACVTGTNTQKAYLDFPDSDGAYSAQSTLLLPADWTGNIDVQIRWMSAITTGDVFWQVSTICVADGETDDPAFNTASTVADTAKGTTNQTNNAAIAGVTITGCAAGELLHLKIMRDRTNASDTLGASAARLIGVELTMRRAQ